MSTARIRENSLVLALATIGVTTMSWLSLYGYGWNDYDTEARPAFTALTSGHLLEFLRLAPAYGGSLVLRAPFALLPSLWGGGSLAVYRAVSIPCLVVAALFGVWLLARMRAQGQSNLARAVALGLCVANPLTLYALELGHPEEVAGAVLCVLAVLAAMRERPLLAGLLLGLAIANKEWALLALGPMLLALPARRLAALAVTGATTVLILAPLLLAGSAFASAAHASATTTGVIFQPWQFWWFFGHHHGIVSSALTGIKVDYRKPPTWLSPISHPLIIALSLPLTLLYARRASVPRDPLLLLTLLMLLRAVLDPWDTVYYLLPFVMALMTWEVLVRRQPAVGALLSVTACWVVFEWMPNHTSPDAQAAFTLVFALPALLWLLRRLYLPPRSRPQPVPVLLAYSA